MTNLELPREPTLSRNTRWPELDGLRGTAILLVLLLHYVTDSRTHEGDFGPLYRFAQVFRLGWSGVDLFFVLSGFLIGGILLDAGSSPNYFQTFYTRRAYRILPIYYVWITLCAIANYAILSSGSPENAATVGSSLRPFIFFLFLQNFAGPPASLFSKYMVSPTWSLAVEEQFYLVAPFLIRHLSLRRLTQVLLLCVIGAPILRYLVFSLLQDGATAVYILMPCRADALAMGILSAIAWRTAVKDFLLRRTLLLKILAGGLLIGALAMTKWMPGPKNAWEAAFQYSWTASLYTSILLIALLDGRSFVARAARWRVLGEFGRISYCFYLIHLGILGICHWIFFRSQPHIDDWLGFGVTLVALILAWSLAQLSWKYFEKPLIDRGHTKTYNPQ